MEYRMLNDGNRMPMVGIGTYLNNDPVECERSVFEAIRAGYRLIDTAQAYGNEEAVGRGIRRAIRELDVTREELFVAGKVWFRSFEPDACRASVEESLRKLGVDYLDLMLLHWPFGNVYGAWRTLENMQMEGKIRSIGVSNMTMDRLLDLIEFNRVTPAVNQIETHLYCQRKEERAWMRDLGVAAQAYAPLGQGRIAEMSAEPVICRIAQTHGKSAAQVMLRFLTQGQVGVIPKTVHADRMAENLDVFDFTLSEEEITALEGLDTAKPFIGDSDNPDKVRAAFTW